jgi:hypothetical protein
MAFDPDAYLASKKPAAGFDPDAYLSSKKEIPAPETGGYARGAAEGALRTLGKGAVKVAGFIPDVATDIANLVPESILGPKVQRPSEYWEEKLFGESRPGEELSSEALAIAATGGAELGAKGIQKGAKFLSGELGKEVLPKTKKAVEDIAERIRFSTGESKAKALSAKETEERRIFDKYSEDDQKAASAALRARNELAERARTASRSSAEKIRKQRGLMTPAEADASESMTHAGLFETKPEFGGRMRSDLADVATEADLLVREGKAYGDYDRGLTILDKTNPFQMSKSGRDFFSLQDSIIKPPPAREGEKVIQWTAADQAIAKRMNRILRGSPSVETIEIPVRDPITTQIIRYETAQKVGERPRSGAAIDEALFMARRRAAKMRQKGRSDLGSAWDRQADRLEQAVNNWTGGQFKEATSKYRRLKELANSMENPVIRKLLNRSGNEFTPEAERGFVLDRDDVPKTVFSGSDSVDAYRSLVGDDKFIPFAQEFVSENIGGKSATEALAWAKKNKWVDTVPGLRAQVDAYSERMARFSNDRNQIEAIIKDEQSRLKQIGLETKKALSDAKSARAASMKEAGAARDKALEEAEKTMKSRVDAAENLANFMTGKRPSEAFKAWDTFVQSAKKSGMTGAEITSIGDQLRQAVHIEDRQEKYRSIRKLIYAALGLSSAAAGGIYKVAGAGGE